MKRLILEAWGALLVVALGYVAVHGVLTQKLEHSSARSDSLRVVQHEQHAAAVVANTVYVHDTVQRVRVYAHTDTVLSRIRDTVVHIDTVRELIAAERKACSVVVTDCDRRHAADTLELRTATARAAALEHALALKDRRRLLERVGLCVGAGAAVRPDGTVTAAGFAGACVRFWP